MLRDSTKSFFRSNLSQVTIDTIVENRLYQARRYWQDSLRSRRQDLAVKVDLADKGMPLINRIDSEMVDATTAELGSARRVMDIAFLID